MKTDQFQDYQIEFDRLNLNSDPQLPHDDPHNIAYDDYAEDKDSDRPMPLTISVMKNCPYFSQILLQLSPDLFIEKEESQPDNHQNNSNNYQEKQIQIDGDNSNIYNQLSEKRKWGNPFDKKYIPSKQVQVLSKNQIQDNHNRPSNNASEWCDSSRNSYSGLNVRSNPFNFLQPIQQEEPYK